MATKSTTRKSRRRSNIRPFRQLYEHHRSTDNVPQDRFEQASEASRSTDCHSLGKQRYKAPRYSDCFATEFEDQLANFDTDGFQRFFFQPDVQAMTLDFCEESSQRGGCVGKAHKLLIDIEPEFPAFVSVVDDPISPKRGSLPTRDARGSSMETVWYRCSWLVSGQRGDGAANVNLFLNWTRQRKGYPGSE